MSKHVFQGDGSNLDLERVRDLQKGWDFIGVQCSEQDLLCHLSFVHLSLQHHLTFCHNIKDFWSPPQVTTTKTLSFFVILSSSTSTIFTPKKTSTSPLKNVIFSIFVSLQAFHSPISVNFNVAFVSTKNGSAYSSWAGGDVS